jgi:hypothetical protein
VLYGGAVIKQGVNRVGPQLLGVPVSLEDAQFRPLRGYIKLANMRVGNPEGFGTTNLFVLDHLEVDVNMRSLLTDTVVVDRIIIRRPEITYEIRLGKTNVGALLEQLAGEEAPADAEAAPEPEPAEAGAPAKTVVIKELVLAEARAQISTVGMMGQAAPIQLGDIRLTDLGGEGQSVAQITTQILKAIAGAVGNAAAGTVNLVGEGAVGVVKGAGAVGGAAAEGATAVGGAAVEGAAAVGGAAVEGVGKVGGAAVEGVGKVGGAAAEGVGAVGGAAAKGLGALGRLAGDGAKSLTGHGGDDPQEAAEEQPAEAAGAE